LRFPDAVTPFAGALAVEVASTLGALEMCRARGPHRIVSGFRVRVPEWMVQSFTRAVSVVAASFQSERTVAVARMRAVAGVLMYP
jgi:hypothetical protein